jgi:hypothetical protein
MQMNKVVPLRCHDVVSRESYYMERNVEQFGSVFNRESKQHK